MSFFGSTAAAAATAASESSGDAKASLQGRLRSWFVGRVGSAVGTSGNVAESIPLPEKITQFRAPRFAAEFDGIDFFETIVTR